MSGSTIMLAFQQALRRWFPHIERVTKSTLSIDPGENGDFYVVATWTAVGKLPAGSCRVPMTRARVLGTTANAPPGKQRPLQKTCRFSDDVKREILQARGVL